MCASDAIAARASDTLDYVAEAKVQLAFPLKRRLAAWSNEFHLRTIRSMQQVFQIHSGDVAQLVRALPCHGRGRGFEPRRPRHKPKNNQGLWLYQKVTPYFPRYTTVRNF